MPTEEEARVNGRRTMAGVLIMLAGIFNVIDGAVAIYDSHFFRSHLVFGDLHAWGWTMLILGIIAFLVGVAILAGQTWAAYTGIVLAMLNAIGQLLNLPAYPVWSIIIIGIDVLIIYGLTLYGMARAAN
ncbi:MAG TPA: hypothetical protein VGI44_17880 [Acidimicrobiales bacterium]